MGQKCATLFLIYFVVNFYHFCTAENGNEYYTIIYVYNLLTYRIEYVITVTYCKS